jgi:hypothetical protein
MCTSWAYTCTSYLKANSITKAVGQTSTQENPHPGKSLWTKAHHTVHKHTRAYMGMTVQVSSEFKRRTDRRIYLVLTLTQHQGLKLERLKKTLR